jgi:hypothetical protein
MRAYAFITSGDNEELEAARSVDDRPVGHRHSFDSAIPGSHVYEGKKRFAFVCVCGALMVYNAYCGEGKLDLSQASV